jgi:hypothetical protein
MKTKITMAMILATAAIFTSAIIMSATPTPQAYAQQEQFHCSSTQSPSTGGHNTADDTNTFKGCTSQTGQEHSQTINDCRSAGDVKCSGSNTVFGSIHPAHP